jgi:hypothetical protein
MRGSMSDGRPCIIFTLCCQSTREKLAQVFKDIDEDEVERTIDRVLQETAVLIFARHGANNDIWAQCGRWNLRGKHLAAFPSFVREMQLGTNGDSCPVQADGDSKVLEVQGFEKLRQLMEEDRVVVTDHSGLEWSLAATKEEGASTNSSQRID